MLIIQFISHQAGTADINVGVIDDSTQMTGVQKCSSDAVLQAIDALTAALSTELNGGLAKQLSTTTTCESAVSAAAVLAEPLVLAQPAQGVATNG